MGKKKDFGWQDALTLAQSAASAFSATQTAFKEGNKTNLEAAEGGKSAPKLKAETSQNIDQSPLAKEYNRKNFMYNVPPK